VAELIFDLAWFDHLATWRAGATLCTMSRRQIATARSLRERIDALRPTIIYGVPAMFMKLVAGLGEGELHPELKTICFAGEVFPPASLRELADKAPGARLFNLFGPTETNVCTFHEVVRDELDGASELPIGIACPYAECQLVDADGSVITGPGIGELVVSGPTALGGEFATRDRVERKEDGLFYFRGRIDRMVKIRGFRVDPGEVEAALRSHEAVQEAAVVVVVHPRLGKTLHAHVTPRDVSSPPQPKALRTHLAARVAPYMVPERVHVHEELSRTSTGKIDYAALSG
jgi:acyl-coenzyme A synthetase/AMP-(fatty) acid ligase